MLLLLHIYNSGYLLFDNSMFNFTLNANYENILNNPVLRNGLVQLITTIPSIQQGMYC